jgi:CRP/FNR family transcriptional regulator, cyclic AMP receptor protein
VQKRKLKKGELLILKGDASKEVYYLEKGRLLAYTYVNGERIALGDVNEGELVGEISMILSQDRSATVEAKTESVVISLPANEFHDLLKSQHPWVQALVKTLASRVKELNERLIQNG